MRSRRPQAKGWEINVDSLIVENVCGTTVGVAKVFGNVGFFDRFDVVVIEEFPEASSLDYRNVMAVVWTAGNVHQTLCQRKSRAKSGGSHVLSDVNDDGVKFV